jgi:hypothetical protein
MDSGLVSAVAALTGAAIGGAASFLGSWLGQQKQVRAEWLREDRSRRQDLYREFIEEAAKCYIDALQHDKPDISSLVILYAKISRMRVLSSAEVIATADEVLKRIIDAYSEPAITLDNTNIQSLVENKSFDLLRALGEACRTELTLLRSEQF